MPTKPSSDASIYIPFSQARTHFHWYVFVFTHLCSFAITFVLTCIEPHAPPALARAQILALVRTGLCKLGIFVDQLGVKYQVEAHDTETIGEMKGGKWMAYAARALIVRFWEFTKVS